MQKFFLRLAHIVFLSRAPFEISAFWCSYQHFFTKHYLKYSKLLSLNLTVKKNKMQKLFAELSKSIKISNEKYLNTLLKFHTGSFYFPQFLPLHLQMPTLCIKKGRDIGMFLPTGGRTHPGLPQGKLLRKILMS